MQFDRRAGGVLCVEIVTPETPSAQPWVELVKRDAIGETIGFVAVKSDELDRMIEALTECRNVLLGHPKHRAKERLG